MNWISILGLLTLLGLAWAMSYYRRDVKLRPILWGLGLQFVLALIILREDVWSFVGMGLLGLLVILYLLDERQEEGGVQWRKAVVVIAASLAVAALVLQLPTQFLLMGLAAVLAAWKLSGWPELMGRVPGPDDLVTFVSPSAKLPIGSMWTKERTQWRRAADLKTLGLRHRRGHDGSWHRAGRSCLRNRGTALRRR